MLRFNGRPYHLVRAHSGFFLGLDSPLAFSDHQWRLELHFVPDHEEALAPVGTFPWEYFRLRLDPFQYRVEDWRDLGAFGFDRTDKPTLMELPATVENLLDDSLTSSRDRVYDVQLEDLVFRRAGGYEFHCEIDAVTEIDDAIVPISFIGDLPFREVCVGVPINAADPVATAKAIVARKVRLTEFARQECTRGGPRPDDQPKGIGDHQHSVDLETPWRRAAVE